MCSELKVMIHQGFRGFRVSTVRHPIAAKEILSISRR